VPLDRLVAALTANLLRNRSDLMVIPGYHRAEYWAMLLTCVLLRRKRIVCVGCPVGVSNICGCVTELVREGVTGYSYPFGDIPALCEAMIAAAKLSSDRLSVAKRCMNLVGQYTPERAASEILKGCVCITEAPQ
jgi:glycosyltransferase involved in cell wall biosynthesis